MFVIIIILYVSWLSAIKDVSRNLYLTYGLIIGIYPTDHILEIKDWMARYTTDVISSCAFGIESNTLMNPEAEFRTYLRRFTTYTALKSFATLAISFAPKLQSLLKLKILDDDIVTFMRNTVWSTVEYR